MSSTGWDRRLISPLVLRLHGLDPKSRRQGEAPLACLPRATDLSCRWIDPIWAASGNCIHSSFIILMYLSCAFLLFCRSLPLKLCPPSPHPRFPPTLGASQSRFSQGGGRGQWDAFLRGGGGGARRSLSEPGVFKDFDRWIRRQQSLRRNSEPVGVVPVHYGKACALIAQTRRPVFFLN